MCNTYFYPGIFLILERLVRLHQYKKCVLLVLDVLGTRASITVGVLPPVTENRLKHLS